MNPAPQRSKRVPIQVAQAVVLAVSVLLPSLAHAQGSAGEIVPTPDSTVLIDRGSPGLAGFPLPSAAAPSQFWASGDLLLWHVSGLPGGNSGAFGTPLGGRFGAGMWLDPAQRLGLEAHGLFLNGQSQSQSQSTGLTTVPGVREFNNSAAWSMNPGTGIDRLNIMPLYENGNREAQHFFNTRLMESGAFGQPMLRQPILSGHWPAAGHVNPHHPAK